MRMYLAGPMRGHALFNFPAFDAVSAIFRNYGIDVVSPADISRQDGFDPATLPEDYDWSQLPDFLDFDTLIEHDLRALSTCDSIALLPGWNTSQGARMELAKALELGLDVHLEFELYQSLRKQ